MKNILGMLFIMFGVFCLIGGIYLLPANMWRDISIGLLCAGTIFSVLGIILFRKKH